MQVLFLQAGAVYRKTTWYINTRKPTVLVAVHAYSAVSQAIKAVHSEYGRQTDFPLTLQPGKYKLTFAIAAWKESPQYKASILTSTSSTIASTQALTATPNAAGNDHADLTSSPLQELDFTIQQAGNYVISFTNANDTGGLQEFLLLDCGVKMLNTGISTMTTLPSGEVRYYDLQGRRLEAPVKGQVIILRSADGRSRKILF